GFAALDRRIDAAAERAGREPAEIERSACVLVSLDRTSRERPVDVPPVEGTGAQIAARLRELADAGADEAILVVSPIDEASVRRLGDALAELGPPCLSAP